MLPRCLFMPTSCLPYQTNVQHPRRISTTRPGINSSHRRSSLPLWLCQISSFQLEWFDMWVERAQTSLLRSNIPLSPRDNALSLTAFILTMLTERHADACWPDNTVRLVLAARGPRVPPETPLATVCHADVKHATQLLPTVQISFKIPSLVFT